VGQGFSPALGTGDMTHEAATRLTVLGASPAFRRGVLLAALAIATLEVGLFVTLWRVGVLVDPGADPRAAATFVLLGTIVTLQAMAVVGVVWVMVALAWTTLRSDAIGWSLDHPWRRWQGSPGEISSVTQSRGWLVVTLHGHRRRWFVRVAADDPAAIARVLGEIPRT